MIPMCHALFCLQMSSISGGMDQMKLPSLTPLILPRNQLRMSTPWFSIGETPDEMGEKLKLAQT